VFVLESVVSAGDKRVGLRKALASDGILQFPGAFNPLSALLIQQAGFDGVYLSGAVVSASLGLPDIGLTSVSEVAGRAQEIARATDLPLIADADTGFGEPMNAARTVQMMEDAGATAIHVEDQVNPKRCGHLDGKEVVDIDTASRRVRATVAGRRDPNFIVIARTDARAIEGLDATLRRLEALLVAGADVLFPEALASLEEFEKVSSAFGVPILANMTEFGKSPLWSKQELLDVGVKIVIYPVSLLRLAMGAAEKGLRILKEEGSLNSAVAQMQTRSDLYTLLDYESYNTFDNTVFNFTLEPE